MRENKTKIVFVLVLLISFASCQTLQLKMAFNKEKPNLWKYDEKKNVYSTDLNNSVEGEIYLWTKYKDYLIDKDTAFVFKQFGTPNIKGKDNNYFVYYMNSECDYLLRGKTNQPNNYNCTYIKFLFENDKLKKVTYSMTASKSEE